MSDEHSLNISAISVTLLVSKCDTSRVQDMWCMFVNSKFNGYLSGWDTSSVEDMSCMFYNSPLSGREPKWYRPW